VNPEKSVRMTKNLPCFDKALLSAIQPFNKPVLSTVRSFDKLRTNGVEGLRANGVEGLSTNGFLILTKLMNSPFALSSQRSGRVEGFSYCQLPFLR